MPTTPLSPISPISCASLLLPVLLMAPSGAQAPRTAPAPIAVGRVTDVLGEPLPATLVTVIANGKTVRRTYTDAEGIYYMTRMPEQGGTLRMQSDGKAPVELAWRGPRTPKVRNVKLSDAGTVQGRIVDADGQAAAGIDVVALFGSDSARTRTDAAGNYKLYPVALGRHTISVWQGMRAAERSLLVVPETRCDFALATRRCKPRQVRVEGLPAAFDEAFVQVVSANIALMQNGGRYPLAGDGTASILLQETVLVSTAAKGFETNPAGRLAVSGSGQLRFTATRIQGSRQTTIRGRVRTTKNKIVRDQRVFIYDISGVLLGHSPIDRGGNFSVQTVLPTNGMVRIGMPLDRWEIVDDERTLRDGFTWLRVDDADNPIEIWVQQTGRLEGAVRDSEGVLLALADVVIRSAVAPSEVLVETACNRAGQLNLSLPQGDYDLLATTHDGRVCTGSARVTSRIAAQRKPTQVRWTTMETGAASGQAVDAEGQPLAGIEFLLASREANNVIGIRITARQMVRVFTNRDGRFRCRGLPTGKWTAVAINERDAGFGSTEFTIQVDRGVELLLEKNE